MPRKKHQHDPKACEEKEKRMQAAVAAVGDGQSIRGAAKKFGFSYSTLQDHCSGMVYKIASIMN